MTLNKLLIYWPVFCPPKAMIGGWHNHCHYRPTLRQLKSLGTGTIENLEPIRITEERGGTKRITPPFELFNIAHKIKINFYPVLQQATHLHCKKNICLQPRTDCVENESFGVIEELTDNWSGCIDRRELPFSIRSSLILLLFLTRKQERYCTTSIWMTEMSLKYNFDGISNVSQVSLVPNNRW